MTGFRGILQRARAAFADRRVRIGTAAALAAALIAALAVGLSRAGDGEAPTAEEMARPVVVCGDFSLDSTSLNYYFWSEYFYLIGSYGDALPESLDTTQPLSEQMYDQETTWEAYILQQALATVQSTMAMVFEAQAAGFTLPEDYQASMDGVLDAMAANAADAGYTDEAGEPDVGAYLSASYGPGATEASFAAYLENSYLAAAYADQLYLEPTFTDEEISAYYDRYAVDYEAAGIYKEDTPLRSIREVVIRPSGDDDAAWKEAQDSARTLLATWEAESGSEEDFAALARERSAGATAADGGLREHLAPADLTGELADWTFDAARQPGDTAVLSSDEGWVIAYYLGEEGEAVWQKTAEADLRMETYQNAYLAACDRYEFQIDYDRVRIVVPEGLYDDGVSAAETFQSGD